MSGWRETNYIVIELWNYKAGEILNIPLFCHYGRGDSPDVSGESFVQLTFCSDYLLVLKLKLL